ncbi:MAG: rRNA (guanine966-N2)-methyltransferase [Gaiellaceae bacterium]|jgi:16S rRNA (guanine966-N2)-methyltransferase|nr:rRNA (guanine966-N2)-methyltransferase [Gaiellaceae bacterium]
MRIIAGTNRGQRIDAPKGQKTRPTSDRVRENVFNLVAPWVEDAVVLDLFAGSGAMGLEALSRGAERAVFVEADSDAARTINHNLDKLRLTGAQVVWRDVGRYLATETRTYDLIFVDPPYREYEALEPLLARYVPSLLADDGLLVLETSAKVEPQLPLTLRADRRYGAARITLWHK